MDIGVPYLDLGPVDIAALKAYAERLTPLDWLQNIQRQAHFEAHKLTQAVIFMHPIRDVVYPAWEAFKPLMEPLLAKTGSNVAGCMLAKLPAGAQVFPHTDHGPYFLGSHRYHVPLLTNEQVIFTLGGVPLHMQAGRLYEINNVVGEHAVVNGGATDRVHLIFDVKAHAAPDH